MNLLHCFSTLRPPAWNYRATCLATMGLRVCLALFTFAAIAQPCLASAPVWVLIDTKTAVVKVMAGDQMIARYDNLATGRRGTAELHLRGDDTTPLGSYRINSINRDSGYELFLGLDYPTSAHAERALQRGTITRRQYQQIVAAHARGAPPPATTALGGGIGIHGIGKGSLRVHRRYNWTHGCVALDNGQIRDLARRVKIGTPVVIQ